MKYYKSLLLKKLIDSGWELLEQLDDTDWWLDEMWKVKSVKQYWGYQIFISFLVDLQYVGNNKGSAVWAVVATNTIPTERPINHEYIIEMDLVKGKFDQKLEAFVHGINKHRDEVRL